MSCEQVKELLSAYLDNMLASEDQQSVSSHLASCEVCRSLLDDFRRYDALLSELPRVAPDPSLHDRIFSSPAYQELIRDVTTTADSQITASQQPTVPHRHPHLMALTDGRHPSISSTISIARSAPPSRHLSQSLRIMRTIIAASILLTLGMGAFISYNLWFKQGQVAHQTTSITPPAGLSQGPVPAGIRFVFQRDGALWSAPSDGSSGIVRLSPTHTTIATSWAVRPPLPGRPAGNMLAYIDLQQGFMHTIRSDGQEDTVIQQPLLKSGIAPSSIWKTDAGSAILNSLSWSSDGNMLAFTADPQNSGLASLYIYTLNSSTVHAVSLPIQGKIEHLTWSPDSVRLAFEMSHDGNTTLLDYNTQNQGVLTLASGITSQTNPGDTILSLNWSPDRVTPAITWSVGSSGHIHMIWWQRVGVEGSFLPQALATGDFTQAIYNQSGHHNLGSWLLIAARSGLAGDMTLVSLSSSFLRITYSKQVGQAQWSPNGSYISYFDAVSSGRGVLHIVNTMTLSDRLVTASASTSPSPIWAPDSLHLAYTADAHTLVVNAQTPQAPLQLKLSGSPSSFSWSAASSSQLVLSTSDGPPGVFLIDTQRSTFQQLDKMTLQGSILWTQIP